MLFSLPYVIYIKISIDVTMVQRGPTYVMNYKSGSEVLFKGTSTILVLLTMLKWGVIGFYWENSLPMDVADRLVAATPRFMAVDFYQRQVRHLAELDKSVCFAFRYDNHHMNLCI